MQPNKKISRSKRSSATGNYKFPEDLGQHQIIFIFRKYSFSSPGSRRLVDETNYSKAEIKDVIALPIPGNIADSYSIRLSRPEMGLAGETIANATADSNLLGGNTQGLVNDILTKMKNIAPGVEDWRNLFAGDISNLTASTRYLIRSNLPSFAAQGIDLGQGATVNPKLALSFEGVDLKSHSFDWNFMVRSPGESDDLRNIQNAIKRNIHPSYSDGIGIKRAMLNYPSVVDVFFSGLDGDYFVKFKTCMVQSFSMNFTPSGLAILEGGKPAAAQMTLQLIETDIHTSEDYGGETGFVTTEPLETMERVFDNMMNLTTRSEE